MKTVGLEHSLLPLVLDCALIVLWESSRVIWEKLIAQTVQLDTMRTAWDCKDVKNVPLERSLQLSAVIFAMTVHLDDSKLTRTHPAVEHVGQEGLLPVFRILAAVSVVSVRSQM